ncbi:MAG TPA: hypothetical protein VI172_01710 [Candidatus Dormibacteraeota bacterium]|jgi:hypothetical protein
MPRRLSARRADAIIAAATLVKAPNWADTRNWHVVSDGQILVVVAPSYGGASSNGRNGWTWRLADHTTNHSEPQPTREKAAVAGLAAWKRWATN